MQRLEVSGAVRPIWGSLGVKGLIISDMSPGRPWSNLELEKLMHA